MKQSGKFNLTDCSFLLPVRIDYPDRLENLSTIVRYLNYYFDTQVSILEVDSVCRIPESIKVLAKYEFELSYDPMFKRTLINNKLLQDTETPIAILYDADVIIPPIQLVEAIEQVRNKVLAFALPYDGRFLQVDKYTKRMFARNLSIDFLEEGQELYRVDTYHSVGGCFICDLKTYKTIGLENEYIEGWGHDDSERNKRLKKLGYKIYRSKGPLYHLHHERGKNSYFFDEEKAMKSLTSYLNTCASSRNSLMQQVSRWPWISK